MSDEPVDAIDVPIGTDGSAVLRMESKPVIPDTVHGFSLRVGVGPYPPDQPNSHRRAITAELIPVEERARKFMDSKNRARVLGMVPLTPEGAAAIEGEPNGSLAEAAAGDAIRIAIRELKREGYPMPKGG